MSARIQHGDPAAAFIDHIRAALGGYGPDAIEPGRLHRFPTRDRRNDDAGWCKLFDDMRGGVFGCNRQGISETWRAVDRTTMTREQRAELAQHVAATKAQREALQRQAWALNERRIAKLWAQCVPLTRGDPVVRYLENRGVDRWPLPGVLRLHPALTYWHRGEQGVETLGTFAAMVAPIVAPDGRMVSLHQTYLTEDGRKAAVPIVRKVAIPAGPLAGACIPLFEPARGCIGIAEGIETALSARCASGVPTVAARCADSLATWKWPADAQRLVIFADADRAGRRAADTLRARALAARLPCEVLTPTTEGADWCDVWAERGAVLIEAGGAA